MGSVIGEDHWLPTLLLRGMDRVYVRERSYVLMQGRKMFISYNHKGYCGGHWSLYLFAL